MPAQLETARVTVQSPLYEIDAALEGMLAQAMDEEAETGAVSAETQQAIREYFSTLETKADRIAEFIKACEAKVAEADTEAKRVQKRKQRFARFADSTKQMVVAFLGVKGVTRIEGRLNTLRAQANPPAVRITGDVPEDFQHAMVRMPLSVWREMAPLMPEGIVFTAETDVDKSLIAAALKQDIPVPGAELDRSGKHLRID